MLTIFRTLSAITATCFLTRDEKIIKHRQWLEEKFSRLKIRLPSELAEIEMKILF
jgi:hypothetical protein